MSHDLVQVIAQTVDHLDKLNMDASASKSDVCSDIRNRLALIMGKVVAYPIATNFSLPYVDVDLSVSNNEELTTFFEQGDV